jgi:hypothetical protein
MKKIIFAFILLFSLASEASAQRMSDCFVNMPDSILTLLSKNNRLDCVDFIQSNMKAVVRNIFDGKSELLTLTDDYLKMRLSDADYAEMMLLPTGDTTKVICMVRTFLGPKGDSNVRFYASNWAPLPTDRFITLPQYNDFWRTLSTDSADALQYARNRVDVPLVVDSLSAADKTLHCALNIDALTAKNQSVVKSFIRPVVFHWKKNKFVPIEATKP